MKLKKQVKGAMVYPITIMSIAVIVVGVILVFVIPTFAKMFADFGGELPAPTKIVIALSSFLQKYILRHYCSFLWFESCVQQILCNSKRSEGGRTLSLKSCRLSAP